MAPERGCDVLIDVRDLARRFVMGESQVAALDGVSFAIRRGEYVSITGPSGSGKSTLLHLLGCLDTQTGGTYHLDGAEVHTLADAELARLRNRSIGFVFQAFHLLPRTSALDNVALPLSYRRVPRAERRRLALRALEQVELAHRREHTPDSLSGGERQRVAIARALVGGPSLLLCDEPTGNLDQRAGAEITRLFEQLNASLSVTVVVVTHDLALARRAPRALRLVDGRLVYDGSGRELVTS
jgi:putative ABC transport system ATP-binding protein